MLMNLAWEDDDEREEDIPYPDCFSFSSVLRARGYKRASIQTFLDGFRCKRPNKKLLKLRVREEGKQGVGRLNDGTVVDELTSFFTHWATPAATECDSGRDAVAWDSFLCLHWCHMCVC